jgi:O-antigen/teichoic acid export membrane protein
VNHPSNSASERVPSGRRGNFITRFELLFRVATPGQLDAGFASLGSFLIQLLVLRTFDALEIGAYAFAYTGLTMAALIPANLVFAPYELKAIDYNEQTRLDLLRSSLPPGLLAASSAGLLLVLATIPAWGQIPPSFFFGLVATGWLAMVASVIQDHVRRMAHIGSRSWIAAGMSGVYLASTLIGFLVLHLGSPKSWAPFGVMLAANVLGLLFFVLARGERGELVHRLARSELREVGGWLLLGSAGIAVGGFVSMFVIEALAGLESVGHIEAARVVGRPVQVIGLGLLAVVAPRIMTAAHTRDVGAAIRWSRFFWGVLGSVAALFTVGLMWPVVANELEVLLPVAFVVPWLAVVTAPTSALAVADVPLRAELLGYRGQIAIARGSLLGAGAQVLASALAIGIGAMAGPIAAGVGGVTSLAAMGWSLRRARRPEVATSD